MLDFLKLDGSQWEQLIERAREFVELNERALYLPYHEMIAAEIAGMGGVYRSNPGEAGVREYWTEKNPFPIAQQLALHLYERVDAPFIDRRLIEIKTNLRNRNVTLIVNSQRLYQFVRMTLPNPPSVILPLLVDGSEAAPLPRAIAKCHALYRVGMAEQWPAISAEFRKLVDQILAHSRSGGGESPDPIRFDQSPCEFDTNPLLLESSYIGAAEESTNDMVRIGTFAGRPTYFLDKAPTPSKGGRVAEHKIYIQSDFRLRKWTVYSPAGGAEYDVYNSTLFDLVPVGEDGTALPIVQLRFALISLLMDAVIAARNPDNRGNSAALLRTIRRLTELAECPSPGTTFVGKHIDESIDFMRMVKAEDRIPPFHPAFAEAKRLKAAQRDAESDQSLHPVTREVEGPEERSAS